MAFETFYPRKLSKWSKGKNAVSINSQGLLYFPNYHPNIERFDLMWDEETSRIGIKPNNKGRKRFTKARTGKVTTLKSFLEYYHIPYPQKCEAAWDDDIYVIKVRR